MSVINAFHSSLFGTWEKLPPGGRKLFGAAFLVYVAGFLIALAAFTGVIPLRDPKVVGIPAGVLAFVGMMVAAAISVETRRAATEQKVEAAEERAREHPKETQYTWEVARLKLESYLDRNLRQVSWIFGLTVFVMLCGLTLVGFGIWRAVNVEGPITMPLLAAASGIVIQIIGGTLLIIYRSTMEQAKNYVVVLERINAVGMSINIIESIEESDAATRNKARAELARDLLSMYAHPPKAIE